MTDNSTSTHLQSIKTCFDAQTSRGRFDDNLNPDIGGALVALASMFHFPLSTLPFPDLIFNFNE